MRELQLLNSPRELIDMEDGLEVWRTALHCQAGEPTWVDDAEQVSRAQATCGDGSEVHEYRVEGMTPCLAALLRRLTARQRDIWQFFAAHARG